VIPKPRRHSKPRLSPDSDGPAVKLIVGAGRAAGLEPSDIIHAITAATGLDGEAVRNVRVLELFSFVEVPEQQAQRIVESVDGTDINGARLRLEVART
jgi:ATP-dependent RNA helicase DeaD